MLTYDVFILYFLQDTVVYFQFGIKSGKLLTVFPMVTVTMGITENVT